jgi:phage I-like protein
MKAGRLSYTVDAAGQRRIDTAELDRVFRIENLPSIDGMNGASGASACEALQSNTAHAGEHAALERLLADREACIADLRGRLDASEAERRQLSERLTGLLTVKREVAANAAPSSMTGEEAAPSASSGLAIPRPPWWRRWFR